MENTYSIKLMFYAEKMVEIQAKSEDEAIQKAHRYADYSNFDNIEFTGTETTQIK